MRAVVTDGVVVKEDEVLLIKRAIEPYKGFWVLPGGHVEDYETVEEACIREVKEETGLDVKIICLVGVFSGPNRDERRNIAIAFLCIPLSETLKGNKESTELGYFSFNSLPTNIGFDHKLIIKKAKDMCDKYGI